MKTTTLLLAGSVALFGACGGDDDGGSGNTVTNTASATGTITQINGFTTAFAGSDGASAATSVYGLGAQAQGIVSYAPPDQGRIGGSANVTGTCDCDGTSCTFTNCGDDAGGWTINGTISKSGDTYTWDLDMTVGGSLSGGFEWDWSQEGSLTITATSIDGDISGNGDGTFDDQQGGTVDVSWDWDASYNAVQLDTSGCATGGSMDASSSYSAGGSAGGGSFSGSASVSFGPACGDVTAN